MSRFFVFLSVLNLLSGCNDRTLKARFGNDSQANFANTTPETKVSWALVRDTVLGVCFQCHASGQRPQFSDSASVLANSSMITSEVAGNQMPPASRGYSALNACQKRILATWIEEGGPAVGSKTLGDLGNCRSFTGGGSGSIGSMPLTYETLLTQILQPRCLKCHTTDHPLDPDASGILFYPYSVLSAPGQVERWSTPSAQSTVVTILSRTDADRMPPPEDSLPLPSDQIDFIKRWIDAGRPEN